MKIDLYSYCYNDEDIMPLYLDYYSFVDRMTFLDSGSTDGTLDLIRSNPTQERRIIQTRLTSYKMEVLQAYKNTIWRTSEFDIVMFPDMDEIFFYEGGLRAMLEKNRYDVYQMEGYEMVSNEFPKGKITDVRTGVRFPVYDKSTIWNPQIDIYFANAHTRECATKNISIGDIKLLHYRNLGVEQMKRRRDILRTRTTKDYYTTWSDEEIYDRHTQLSAQAKEVIWNTNTY